MDISIRSQYMAPPGYVLVAADLSQAESWIVAYLADEPNMKFSLNQSDIHRDTAGNALFFGDIGCTHVWNPIKGPATCELCGNTVTKVMRYVGKRYNHASAYRMGANRAAQVINKDSDKPPYVTVTLAESRTFSVNWHSYYNLKGWWADLEHQLDRNGRTLVTPYDRSRTFYQAWGDELFKEATAFIPQSTVSDHCKGRVHRELGIKGGLKVIYKELIKPYPDHKMVNESHDSCMLEVPYAIANEILERTMGYLYRPLIINGETFTIPVDGEIGERWGELKAAA